MICSEFKYTDKELDEDSGLYYFQARYYDPMGGRFLGRDRYSLETDLTEYFQINPYQYVNNNPLRFTDPDGKWKDPNNASRFVAFAMEYFNNRANHPYDNTISLSTQMNKSLKDVKGMDCISFVMTNVRKMKGESGVGTDLHTNWRNIFTSNSPVGDLVSNAQAGKNGLSVVDVSKLQKGDLIALGNSHVEIVTNTYEKNGSKFIDSIGEAGTGKGIVNHTGIFADSSKDMANWFGTNQNITGISINETK